MKELCHLYKQQVTKAKETVDVLENELHEIRLKLQKNPMSAILLQELKKITLDMTITLNELEHSQSAFEQCMREQNHVDESKYND